LRKRENRHERIRISTKLTLQRAAQIGISGKRVEFLAEGLAFIAPCATWQGSGAETRASEESPPRATCKLISLCSFLGQNFLYYTKFKQFRNSNYIRCKTELGGGGGGGDWESLLLCYCRLSRRNSDWSRLKIPEDLNQVQYNEVTNCMKKKTDGLEGGERPCNQMNTKPSTTNAAWETGGGKKPYKSTQPQPPR
jgi:hypothetical protein